MKLRLVAMVMGVAFLCVGSARAHDGHGDVKNQCVQDARTERNTCTKVCQDTFLASMDTCHGVNHDCADTARASRESCVSAVLATLKQCVDDTCGVYQTLIDQCRKDNLPDTEARDACIDGVQVQNFQCRDQCRESVKLFAGLKTCRDEFKVDLQACKLPPTPAPTAK